MHYEGKHIRALGKTYKIKAIVRSEDKVTLVNYNNGNQSLDLPWSLIFDMLVYGDAHFIHFDDEFTRDNRKFNCDNFCLN